MIDAMENMMTSRATMNPNNSVNLGNMMNAVSGVFAAPQSMNMMSGINSPVNSSMMMGSPTFLNQGSPMVMPTADPMMGNFNMGGPSPGTMVFNPGTGIGVGGTSMNIAGDLLMAPGSPVSAMNMMMATQNMNIGTPTIMSPTATMQTVVTDGFNSPVGGSKVSVADDNASVSDPGRFVPGRDGELSPAAASMAANANPDLVTLEPSPNGKRISNQIKANVVRKQVESFFTVEDNKLSLEDKKLLRKNMDDNGFIQISTLIQVKAIFFPGHEVMRQCLNASDLFETNEFDEFRLKDQTQKEEWLRSFSK